MSSDRSTTADGAHFPFLGSFCGLAHVAAVLVVLGWAVCMWPGLVATSGRLPGACLCGCVCCVTVVCCACVAALLQCD
jgi:hypothetical protein